MASARVKEFSRYLKMDQDALELAMREVDGEIDTLRAEKEIIGRAISARASESKARALLNEMTPEEREAFAAVLSGKA